MNLGVFGLATFEGGSLEDDSVQYNAGEIRLRLKLTQVVPGQLHLRNGEL